MKFSFHDYIMLIYDAWYSYFFIVLFALKNIGFKHIWLFIWFVPLLTIKHPKLTGKGRVYGIYFELMF